MCKRALGVGKYAHIDVFCLIHDCMRLEDCWPFLLISVSLCLPTEQERDIIV